VPHLDHDAVGDLLARLADDVFGEHACRRADRDERIAQLVRDHRHVLLPHRLRAAQLGRDLAFLTEAPAVERRHHDHA